MLDSGGALGRLFAGIAERYLNLSGALILLVLVLIISLMVLTNLSWVEVGRGVSRLYSCNRGKRAEFLEASPGKKKEGAEGAQERERSPSGS